MTIDEAISHALEVAERQEYLSHQNHGYCEKKRNVEAREQCAECAAEHRQLAEWLTELKELKATDVQPLSVVAEHIKNRLYETALNTNGAESDTIAAMAERIDFWIDELKDGDKE